MRIWSEGREATMRHQFLVPVLSVAMLACQVPKRHGAVAPAPLPATLETSSEGIRYLGGQGATCNDAVQIVGARGEFDGVRAEYDWVGARFPGYRMNQQALLMNNGRSFDLLAFTTASGDEVEVCFDITSFYGKW
jgi:hypothetical protein